MKTTVDAIDILPITYKYNSKKTLFFCAQGKRTIYPASNDVQVKRYILLAYPLQYLLCLYNFHFLFSTLLLFSFFNYDSIFNPSRRPQRAPTSEGIGSSLLARKKMESSQRRCSCCKEKTSYYCSSPKYSLLWGPNPKFVYIC